MKFFRSNSRYSRPQCYSFAYHVTKRNGGSEISPSWNVWACVLLSVVKSRSDDKPTKTFRTLLLFPHSPFPHPPQCTLFAPQNFAWALSSVSLGTTVISRRNGKQRLCRILDGKQGALWGMWQWRIGQNESHSSELNRRNDDECFTFLLLRWNKKLTGIEKLSLDKLKTIDVELFFLMHSVHSETAMIFWQRKENPVFL